MEKRIFKNFLWDHLFFTIIYFISNFLIGLFYYISVGSNIEIIYPASLSIFVYIIFIIYKWVTYRKFNFKAVKLAENMYYDIKAYTFEENEIIKLITNIHQSYLEKISLIRSEDESKRRFLSQWIHNMKTPIVVMDLIFQKTIKEEIPKEKALEDIKEENIKLLNNLEQALKIVRLENFTEDYVPEEVDLIQAVRNVINSRKNEFIYSRVYPKININEDSVKVLSDKKWNEAMLEQIVSNAVKYSDCGKKAKNVYFSIKKVEDKVILSIRDEGIGIPTYDISRVFNPFFTGENGRNYENATGIGLYFCAQIAKKLGHQISINSIQGEGTEVKIYYLSKS